MSIPLDHYIFQNTEKMQILCKDFFASHGISYFQYYRCYKDGTVTALITCGKTTKRFIELDFPSFSSYKDCHKLKHSYWFFWDEELPWLPVQMGRENGLYHGLTLLRRSLNYFDMIAFAMPEARSNAASYYMTNLKSLELFIDSFEKDHSDIIKEAESNKIMLHQNNRDYYLDRLVLKSGENISIPGLYRETHITARELACLRLRLRGFSYKEIAQNLSISPRSVETYFNRLKERTGYSNLPQLQKALI